MAYDITKPNGQHYRRNRKDLRKLASPVHSDTSVDDFLDDQEFDYDTSKPINEFPRAHEPQPSIIPATIPRHSQRSTKAPVRYADQFS